MTDHELLELAAKAAGINGRLMTKADGDLWLFRDDFCDPWNPLDNDGDALRLAVQLRIAVDPWGAGAYAVTFCPGDKPQIREPHYGDDPLRATRRAIVRAAAEIGRNKP